MILDIMRVTILTEFLRDYNTSLTGSYIAKKNKLNQKSVSNILNTLEEECILKSHIQGRNKLYSLNLDNGEVIRKFLSSVENLRTIRFYENYPLVKEMSSKMFKHVKGSAVIFGSYVKSRARDDSDIDLLIVGKANEKEIDKISELYKKEISVIQYPKIKKIDTLIKEVLKNHIIIKGVEDFITTIMELSHE